MNMVRTLITILLALGGAVPLYAQTDLSDVEMAHVAVTASDIDIAYAHLALALSENPDVRRFAEVMVRDHSAVNGQVVALAERLGVQAMDNPMSRQLIADSRRIKDEMSRLRGADFDRYYAQNELAYHRTVNGAVADVFIPNIENADVKAAFQQALAVFRGHERHAEDVVRRVGGMGR